MTLVLAWVFAKELGFAANLIANLALQTDILAFARAMTELLAFVQSGATGSQYLKPENKVARPTRT